MNELEIVRSINQFGLGTLLDSASILLSSILALTVLGIILLLIICYLDPRKRWKILLAVIIALTLHFLISELLLKSLLTILFDPRIRPFLVAPEMIIPLGRQFFDSSFPSSHMASVVAVLTIIIFYYRKTLAPALVFVLLLGLSRIHNGFHYPTDVLVGMVLGIGYGVLALYLSRKILLKKKKNKKSNKSKSNPHTR